MRKTSKRRSETGGKSAQNMIALGRARAVAACVGILWFAAAGAHAQDAAAYFRRACVSCHTIGGGVLTGPDLKSVEERKDREWLIRFMADPRGMIAGGDPYAKQLADAARGVIMPTQPDMSRDLAAGLLNLIAAESLLENSQFKGLQISDAPFTIADIRRGRSFFRGETGLSGGGPACIGCHDTADLGWLAGGRLGPDLTLVFERLKGRKGLASWLLAPATPTMRTVFANTPLAQDEILSLTAHFENEAKIGANPNTVAPFNFFLIGLFGAVAGLTLMDIAWKKRHRSARRAQVEEAAKEALYGR